MRDPFRNYDAWLERPYQQQYRQEEAHEQMVEAWEESEERVQAFQAWWLELNPEDLPTEIERALDSHWRKTGHHAGRFQAFCEEQMEREMEPPWDTVEEMREHYS